MNPKLIMHVGPHKTGTTTLQSALDAQRERLREDGIWYPDSIVGAKFPDQHADVAFLLRDECLDECKGYFADLRAKALAAGVEQSVLSSEEFSNLTGRKSFRQFLADLARSWDVRFVYVRRDPAELAFSNLMQHLTGEVGVFFKWGYDIERWILQFLEVQEAKDAFFRAQATTFIGFDEIAGTELPVRFMQATTGKQLPYLATHPRNTTEDKFGGGAKVTLSYPLRVMLGMLYGESVSSPRCMHEALEILGDCMVDEGRFADLLQQFQAQLKRRIAGVIAARV
jgi:hypothetical protein